ncbi:DUF4157 domain-containing protein [Streptomyces sp. R-07]|uniref:eCIS core domain-containing protein n=1 Tax=unclassified Streptomyces TaxID=2593676 RepID=UPI0037CE96EC
MLALQRTAGNAAVLRMLQLSGHPYAQPPVQGNEGELHQHGASCGHRQAERPAVQRSAVHDVLAGPGRPLDVPLREEMESRLGADFSDVRIHDGSAARASAAEIGARAYTSGNDIALGEGGTDKHTLAHELTHVIQQRQGPVAGTDNGAGLSISDPSDRYEQEAEANAQRVMSQTPVQQKEESAIPSSEGTPSVSASASVQRMFNQPNQGGQPLTPQQQAMQDYQRQLAFMQQQQMQPGYTAGVNANFDFGAGYTRMGIPDPATRNIFGYQTGGAPSPRAGVRASEISNMGGNLNPFDVAGHQNFTTTGNIGADPNGVSMSRNHRLSDHYVAKVLNKVLQNYNHANQQHQAGVVNFIRSCVPSYRVEDVSRDFLTIAGIQVNQGNAQGVRNGFRQIVSDVSNNERNLRFGASGLNSGIGKKFDAGYFANEGGLTPISSDISAELYGLVDAGLLPGHLAEEALDVRLGKETSSGLI